MKTLLIYDTVDGDLRYSILDGDYSHLNGIKINSDENPEKEEEANNLIYNDETCINKIPLFTDTSIVESKQWDKVIVITFLP